MVRNRRATIRDVATLAGVSPATVSLVINNTGLIGEKTTQRVCKAMQHLNYQPNIVARGLRSQKTATIGLIMTNIANLFYPSIARGVEDLANQLGYNVILCNSDEDSQKETRYIDDLLSRQVDGFLLVPTRDSLANLEKIRQGGHPIVLLDRHIDGYPVDAALVDNRQGAYSACDHLITEHGCRNLGIITGPLALTTGHERLAGYRAALEAHGIPFRDSYVYQGDFTEQAGYEGARILVENNPGIQAIFVVNNLMCIGTLNYLQKAQLAVPERISLICFDEMPWSALITPPLSTVSQFPYNLGRTAADILVQRLQGDLSPYRVSRIPTELVLRRSCGCHLHP